MEPIHAAFSLRWKILAWFFVNLLVIGTILFGFLRAEFHVGINSLLAGPTNDRLEAIARPLVTELRTVPETRWNNALESAAAAWRGRGLRAGLYRNDGTYVAGDVPTPPKEVLALLDKHEPKRFGPGGGRPGPGGGERRGPPPSGGRGGPSGGAGDENRVPGPDHSSGNFPFDEPAGGPPDDHGSGEGPPGLPPDDQRDGTTPSPVNGNARPLVPEPLFADGLRKFMVATDGPRLYWAGVDLGPIHRSNPGGPPSGVSLLLVSDSLRGGGLFFDYVPWLLVGGSLTLVSLLLWLPFVHGLTRSLKRMTLVAEEIAQGRFNAVPPTKRRDELGRLGRALGHMAHRLDGFVSGQKRFLGDTAHELLSPLARLEVALSILEQQAASEDHGRYAERALDEVRHLSDIVQDLLSFTKAGMRGKSTALQTADLSDLVAKAVKREAAEEWVVVAVDAGLRVCAEPDLLVRALANAVRNAVRYAGRRRADHPHGATRSWPGKRRNGRARRGGPGARRASRVAGPPV